MTSDQSAAGAVAPALRKASPWDPLQHEVFRALWIASIASDIGTWMQNVGAAWLMTSLTSSALLIALVQTAATFPIFLLAIPAGTIADLVDRRRLLLVTQSWMVAASGGLAIVTAFGAHTPWLLLGFTFALGLGTAMNAPGWAAIVQELVPRKDLHGAIALKSAGFNVARAVGPALGGLVVAAIGPEAAFFLNSVSFLGVILVLYRWKRPPRPSDHPEEQVWEALRTGLRFARHSSALQTVLIRAGSFIFSASAIWALLPVIARNLGHGSISYGLFLGSIGLGAVTGATLLPRIREYLSLEALVIGGTVLFAAVAIAAGHFRALPMMCGALFFGGVAWLSVMSSLNVSAQTAAPASVRARALGFYLLVFTGGQAGGSAFWGRIAERWSVPVALGAAAVGLALSLGVATRWPFAQVTDFTDYAD